MTIEYQRLLRVNLDSRHVESLAAVDALALNLRSELESRAAEIDLAHVHNAQSSSVQAIVSQILMGALGFKEEQLLTHQDGIVSKPRPDFFYPLGDKQGIIAEVERGGTVNNNHDLKDIWKAHIADDVQHLFLMVPNSNWTKSGAVRERPYRRVVNRMSAFFGDPRREIDVVSCHIFGYGRST